MRLFLSHLLLVCVGGRQEPLQVLLRMLCSHNWRERSIYWAACTFLRYWGLLLCWTGKTWMSRLRCF